MVRFVRKAHGGSESFDTVKLRTSFERAGAPAAVAQRISSELGRYPAESIDSETLYAHAVRSLGQHHRVAATRYGLKRAVMQLGPAGYRFEQYVAQLLEAEDYSVRVGQSIQGYCVRHEVDVLATKGDEQALVECKFHAQPGTRSDIKVALYTHARFVDVSEGLRQHAPHAQAIHHAWLITNTKCTVDAMRYAQCRGLRVIAWRSPHDHGLESLIERHRLYPVTILPSVSPAVLERFGQASIVTMRDLADETAHTLSQKFSLKATTAESILSDAHGLLAPTVYPSSEPVYV